MSVQIRSVNGQTGMLPRVVQILVRQILSDILHNEDSKGIINFANFDYEVSIKKINKNTWKYWFRSFWRKFFKKGEK